MSLTQPEVSFMDCLAGVRTGLLQEVRKLRKTVYQPAITSIRQLSPARWCGQVGQFRARTIRAHSLQLPKLVPTLATWPAMFCADPISAILISLWGSGSH